MNSPHLAKLRSRPRREITTPFFQTLYDCTHRPTFFFWSIRTLVPKPTTPPLFYPSYQGLTPPPGVLLPSRDLLTQESSSQLRYFLANHSVLSKNRGIDSVIGSRPWDGKRLRNEKGHRNGKRYPVHTGRLWRVNGRCGDFGTIRVFQFQESHSCRASHPGERLRLSKF
jgi:hypothetical protein